VNRRTSSPGWAELVADRTLAFLDSRPIRLLSLVVILAVWRSFWPPWQNDAFHILEAWRVGPLYPDHWLFPGSAYVYAPIFRQVLGPLVVHVRWNLAFELWTAAQLCFLVWMVGPALTVAALYFPWPADPAVGSAVYASINNGNPQILTAAVIVVALTRFPIAWVLVLLSKTTAGVGILYYAFKRQWRTLAIVIAATLAVSAISFVLRPAWTFDWIHLLVDAAQRTGSAEALGREEYLPIPLPIRALLGVGVVYLAARTDRRWLVPLGCFLALPDIHLGGFAVLTAVVGVWLRTRKGEPGMPAATAAAATDASPPSMPAPSPA
jgi:hypothetical protein